MITQNNGSKFCKGNFLVSNSRIDVRREKQRRPSQRQLSNPLNLTQKSYLERTSRPISAIFFLLPFIILYEIGTIIINTDVLSQTQIRVVAFVWIQNLLEYCGFHGKSTYIAAPLAVIVILFAWQITSRRKWTVNFRDMSWMAVESIMLAVPLIVLSLLLNRPVAPAPQDYSQETVSNIRIEQLTVCSAEFPNSGQTQTPQSPQAEAEKGNGSLFANIITGIGAGIYEELVFRLILICLLLLFFQDLLRLDYGSSIILAVIVSAALFSAHHHIILLNGRLSWTAPFAWPVFVFRVLAGVYFAVVYSVRGFGITAGVHAFYDIMVALINSAGKN